VHSVGPIGQHLQGPRVGAVGADTGAHADPRQPCCVLFDDVESTNVQASSRSTLPGPLDAIPIQPRKQGGPRRRGTAKKRSTWLSHEALVGVRWTCQRGLLASRLRISGVLWVA
jgi:hypothetical protein